MSRYCLLIALFSVHLHADYHARFESFEHAFAGDAITLQGTSEKRLHLQNGLVLTFGEIIAMGDFYGVPGAPISQGSDLEQRKALFMEAFNSLVNIPESVDEATRIVTAIHNNPTAEDQSVLWNCLTGGACSGSFWWLTPGRYLLLAETDYDHFGDNALKAYVAGHSLALEAAVEAGKAQDTQALERAYAINAFANHFLTDHFSSGHLRLPRVELPNQVTPGVVGSLLGHFMHNEECMHGLHVHNAQGDHWVAYGDGHYLDPENHKNLTLMQQALQMSANDVYEAFVAKQAPTIYHELDLIPEADEIGPNGSLDIAPMFYWDPTTEQLMRRVDLKNPNDRHWTNNWVGWSTLAALKVLANSLGVKFK